MGDPRPSDPADHPAGGLGGHGRGRPADPAGPQGGGRRDAHRDHRVGARRVGRRRPAGDPALRRGAAGPEGRAGPARRRPDRAARRRPGRGRRSVDPYRQRSAGRARDHRGLGRSGVRAADGGGPRPAVRVGGRRRPAAGHRHHLQRPRHPRDRSRGAVPVSGSPPAATVRWCTPPCCATAPACG